MSMSMGSGIKYMFELKERNQRIRLLAKEIRKFNRNKHYFDLLTKDYSEVTSRLESLNNRWKNEYAPALKRRESLSSELYVAKNRPDEFKSGIFEQLQGLAIETIEHMIEDLENSLCESSLSPISRKDALLSTGNLDSDDNIDEPPICQKITSTSSNDTQEVKFISDQSGNAYKRVQLSWSVDSANKKLEELEAKHEEISKSMRALGSQSCVIAAKVNAALDNVVSLEEAMRIPAVNIYHDAEAALLPLQIEMYKAYLTEAKNGDLSVDALNSGFEKLSISNISQDNALPTTYSPKKSFIYPRSRYQHTRSESNTTADSTPSWVISVASSTTEVSSVDEDFSKSTETSLSQVAAQWSLTP